MEGELDTSRGGGLRQGDPLSPLLFVLTMEYLSRALKIASVKPFFKYHLRCKKHDLIHLMFADNLMLFSATDVRSGKCNMDAFSEFSATIGLTTNYNKSSIVLRCCNQQIEAEILQITGFVTGSLPFRSLGVPITASRLSKLECKSLVDKITARIKTWSTKHLSYAGRAALIHLVLMVIYTFWAKVFILPQAVIQEITSFCKNFLWGVESTYRKVPYVAWKEVCMPKANGGIGLRNLEA